MRKTILILGSSVFLGFAVHGWSWCDCDRHWISQKSEDGAVLILEDRSAWEVRWSYDHVTTRLWMRLDNVLLCDDEKIINTDEREEVEVRR